MIVLKELAELVKACKDVKARMSPDNHKIHVDDIAATLQKIIDDEFARANRTFDQVVIDEVIAERNPPDPKTFCETVQAKESDQCAEWGQELAQQRAAHIANAEKARGTCTCAKCNPGESHPDVDWCDICAAPKTGFGPCEDGSTEEDERRDREHFLSQEVFGSTLAVNGEHWEEWGQELAQLREAHIKNAKNNKGNA